MRNSQRAVNTIAIFGFRSTIPKGIVTRFTEVVCAPAMELCNRAAVHALPISEFNAVLLTFSLTNSHLLHQALLAQEVFFSRLALLLCLHLLLTVNQTTEVWLFAAEALVE